MSRTWQENAAEFGALTKQGYGVRLALLAACSVQEGVGSGRSTSAGGPALDAKISARAFARVAGVDDSTVRQHLKKWDRMVEAGWQVDRANLTPDDVNMDLGGAFTEEFEALTEERPPTRHLSPKGITDAIRTDPVAREAMVEAIRTDPQVAKAAHEAVFEADVARAGGSATPGPGVGDPRPAWRVRWLAWSAAWDLFSAEITRLENAGETDTAERARSAMHQTIADHGVAIFGHAPNDASEITS